ncbi:YeeE/YedE family protein [Alkalibacter rhizosphaerae]|uniref:YeeE/YedE family protein n=1 Tax=Alkalibacter rhizosphaerae TaxID=2815577 RepID=A0A975AJ60_9FIRM|nr:YeeE/YedE thiosulfate transporter family protein [Alkalibacter rhizosphaerae]QSX09399.1 YeeE/YedE family protein [Alkalibacter rhizosphaerae]
MKTVTKFMQKKIHDPWTYFKGALLLTLLQILTLLITKNAWGVTTAFIHWGAWIYEALGGDVSSWAYFNTRPYRQIYANGFLKDPGTLRNIGIILGAALAALLAGQFRLKRIKSFKQLVTAAAGGLLMGYGAGIASGCNIGAFYSGIASLSLSGWIFGIGLFIGAYFGAKLIIRLFV